MKKYSHAIAPSKLVLNKEMVRNLTGDMLQNVIGGALPPTRLSQCGTECESGR